MRSTFKGILSILCIVLMATLVLAQTKDQPKEPPKGQQPKQEDMQKMMADMMKMITPGPEHQLIGKMAGDWTVSGQMWMDPKADPTPIKAGAMHSEMTLGGRFLATTQTGEMMGMPYEGHGQMGFDNFRKQYMLTWIDNMGTTISSAAGTADAAGKVISLMGKMDDPSMGKKDEDVKYEYTFKDDKTIQFDIYGFAPDKTPLKMMEMIYTKK
jgi:hypothetical protein